MCNQRPGSDDSGIGDGTVCRDRKDDIHHEEVDGPEIEGTGAQQGELQRGGEDSWDREDAALPFPGASRAPPRTRGKEKQ